MQQRWVTAPDDSKWIVGRRWLLHRPRYFGFRFGVAEHEPQYEPPMRPRVKRKPAPTKPPTRPPVRYTSRDRRRSRRSSSGSGGSGGIWPRGWVFGGGRSGGSRSSGGGFSLGGGSRGSSRGGGSRSGSSGGGKRGGGGGGAAAGGALAALAQILKYALIVVAVIAVIVFMVFVGIPALVFLGHYVAFWIVVGASMLYRALTGRPWIVEMEEADGYRVRSWRVRGWTESKRVIDEIAEAIRRSEEPAPKGAEEVVIENV